MFRGPYPAPVEIAERGQPVNRLEDAQTVVGRKVSCRRDLRQPYRPGVVGVDEIHAQSHATEQLAAGAGAKRRNRLHRLEVTTPYCQHTLQQEIQLLFKPILVGNSGFHLMVDESEHRCNQVIVSAQPLWKLDAVRPNAPGLLDQRLGWQGMGACDLFGHPGAKEDRERSDRRAAQELARIGAIIVQNEERLVIDRYATTVDEVAFRSAPGGLDR